MQMPLKEVGPTEQKAALVERPTVRLCNVAKSSSAKPLPSADIQWRGYTPESAREFSAVACFFTGELLKDPALAGVPIGVVDSSFGGTTCEGWIPGAALTAFNPHDLHDSMFGIKPANPAIFVGSAGILACVALLAALYPAWKASRTDPLTALKYE